MTTTSAAADGNLFIVAAPSGAGKSSLIRALLERHNDGSMQVSVSCTTRAPRPGEIDGEHYHFLDVATFQRKIEANAFYEWAKVFDNYYGTSRQVIEDTLKKGIDVFLDIDWQGARQVREAYPQAQSIFIVPPSLDALEQRLRSRGQDSDEVIRGRMAKAQAEMSHYHEFDYLLVNDDFADTLANFEHIVLARRHRMALQQTRHATKLKDLLANDG
ncbi:guanylate kinase [Pseudidiomarina terrestris]|uniref:Guanylate kinase n=1 Tax=Pseudidiomarina terrestris TaxID=2820060 RepID=A0AAW7R2R8_9GAMM|nr:MULTISPECIES: guanylate kinase [unclassified Pseudidiomarina]MDN7124930.1 guanylate kinase [Pseudidiomarina sp. 1APP75-32.1]MDN7126003.1 guanylate kinase [Pseudidiomarina sp. 1APR75-33.1]MDN7129597.1 guanylate kinase [Pseudidiomarina sp. 1APR75-15]MDN7135912.1 guanylate kinase [Pseudidiomarina sp. 1ASP75-5]MDN7138150.1 guanylate kinase [Pseudidiomarina sp. 1ASP75-14]